ncbi:MAG TPA: CopD family protein [Caulobacteraceae bacterium]|jgi:putative copper resistance protein D|nr:CopD family protein [Caulobacteraceae bacterium]
MSGAPDLAIVAARIATFGLAILLFGGAAFAVYAPPGGAGAAPPRLVRAGAACLALAATAYVALLAREASGDPGWPSLAIIWDVYTQTGFGLALGAAQIAAIVTALAPASAPWRWPRLALAGGALVALAFVGHGADDTGLRADLRIALLAGHLLAVAAWLGALPCLYLALSPRSATPLALLRRFGLVGGICVAAVVGSGGATLAFMVATAGGHLGPTYAATLCVKLAFVAGLLGIAAINRFWLTPNLTREPDAARRALRRTIVLEQVLGLGALAGVAVLGQLDPTM